MPWFLIYEVMWEVNYEEELEQIEEVLVQYQGAGTEQKRQSNHEKKKDMPRSMSQAI